MLGQVCHQVRDMFHGMGILLVIRSRDFPEQPDQRADLFVLDEDLNRIAPDIERERPGPAGIGFYAVDRAFSPFPADAGPVRPGPQVVIPGMIEEFLRDSFGPEPGITVIRQGRTCVNAAAPVTIKTDSFNL
jgi:hypothetical protein